MQLISKFVLIWLAICHCVLGQNHGQRSIYNDITQDYAYDGGQQNFAYSYDYDQFNATIDVAMIAPYTLIPFDTVPQLAIVGGTQAARNQFPFQISLRHRRAHICGGSIISRRYILTAAHCTSGKSASSLSIRAGSNRLRQGGVLRKVSRVIAHPQYRNFYNDIALLQLRAPLTFSTSIRSIPLDTTELQAGVSVRVAGWGLIRDRGPVSGQLKYNDLTSISNAECTRGVSGIISSILCLSHSSGNGVCQGDSGGPAVANGKLVGVTNFVVGNCGTSAPDGFARVSSFISFIRANSDL